MVSLRQRAMVAIEYQTGQLTPHRLDTWQQIADRLGHSGLVALFTITEAATQKTFGHWH